MVERLVANEKVAGSNPVHRSTRQTLNMQKAILILIVIIIASIAIFLLAKNNKNNTIATGVPEGKVEQKADKITAMKITSLAFDHNAKIPSKYTCDGDNINPPLEFVDVPENAKSLVLIVDDPDASGKTWVHWVVYSINPEVTEVEEDSLPEGGTEGMTDFGKPGYGGPCPPSGTHRYFFKLYALHTTLDLPKNATKAMVEEKMEGHIIDKAELIGLYNRE